MDNDIQTDLDRYIGMLEEIQSRVKDPQMVVAVLQEVAMDRRMGEMNGRRSVTSDGAATEKQIEYLRKLGVNVNELQGLTRMQASALIDEAVARSKSMKQGNGHYAGSANRGMEELNVPVVKVNARMP